MTPGQLVELVGISALGRMLVLAGLFFAVFGAVVGFAAGYRRSLQLWFVTRLSAYGFSGSMVAANLLMIYALVKHDFSVRYVAEIGSRSTPVYYTVISLWSSLNGSILFWGAVLGLYTFALAFAYRDKHREYMPYTLAVQLAVSVFFAMLVASVANPFQLINPAPPDGPGPPPLLQNHWLMAYHPPMLYLGYVGMTVPFAMGSAALLAGRLEAGWIAPLRRWFLIPWAFLTLGIMMGSWWSYEVLGWGGYWIWDPVENASFMPWLTGTAFLHSAMAMQRKGQLKTWTLALGQATFLLTLLGTFMTRSDVFDSVHNFSESKAAPIFLTFIGSCLVFSVVLLAVREHLLLEDAPGAKRGAGTQLLSRESMILLQNVAFTVFTFTVLFGVLYPLFTEYFWDKRVAVGSPYFDRMALPLGLVIVFLMGVGPAVPWGRMEQRAFLTRFFAPLVAGLVAAGASFAGGIHKPYVLLAISLCGFAFWANAAETIEPIFARMRAKNESAFSATQAVLTRGRRRFGGHIAHFGFILAVLGIAMTQGYRYQRDFVLHVGESATAGDWTATFEGAHTVREPHRISKVATFRVTRNGKDAGVLEPRLNHYPRMPEPIGTPAVKSRPLGDFYLSLLQIADDGKSLSVQAITMPLVSWLWASAVVIAFGTLVVLWPSRRPAIASAPSDAVAGQTA